LTEDDLRLVRDLDRSVEEVRGGSAAMGVSFAFSKLSYNIYPALAVEQSNDDVLEHIPSTDEGAVRAGELAAVQGNGVPRTLS
jgi:hypothetical protein